MPRMNIFTRALRHTALLFPLVLLAPQATAQQTSPAPQALQAEGETPWIYEGSDVPQDKEWQWGAMDNGLRYAVRKNGVPPRQVSIRIRIDAGSLHERDGEQGFAHLLEHLSFRESKYLAPGEAIPTWQRLGASFGSDTNAETSFTHTAYKLDLPNATPQSIEESFKLLSGMMREPVLSTKNLAAEVPIVLAEKRERGGPAVRVGDKSRATFFHGQLLSTRSPIGTEETLKGATAEAMQAFHQRWYRPENTVISVAGDADPLLFAALIEKYFGDWRGRGPLTPAPDFGDPVAPAGADPANPVGRVVAMVEPDLQRNFTYIYLRPWRKVDDTVVYNEGRLADSLAVAIVQRRLEARARSGGSFLYAGIGEDKVSRSAHITSVSFTPLEDWRVALKDVRAIIADAMTTAPTQEEIDREANEYDSIFVSLVEQRAVMAGSDLADEVISAVDIREAVANPETFLKVFRSMRAKVTPQEILQRTRRIFSGEVIRASYVTPAIGEATEAEIQAALKQPVEPDQNARLSAATISFDELPPIGEPGTIVSQRPLGVLGVERIEFSNGTRALLWANKAEPGRVSVKMRFGAGYRAFEEDQTAYIGLGQSALFSSGQGKLNQEDLDRIRTGRVIGLDVGITESTFVFSAQTRAADLGDQLYLFANKLSDPRWDPNPVARSIAAQRLSYQGLSTSPGGVLQRDLEYFVTNQDGRYKTADLDDLGNATAEGFREVWAPLLEQGEIEIIIFGDFDQANAIEALRKTIGALPPRKPIPVEALVRVPEFPAIDSDVVVRTHRGDSNQAAAVVAWPTGGGVVGLRESRQLEILAAVFNNRLIEAMRERAGASYSPQVGTKWPVDISAGGRITALAQLRPEDVPAFFKAADTIAYDLAAKPLGQDELKLATEPLKQLITRASTGNLFWLYQIEGSSADPRRLYTLNSLRNDYSVTTPQQMQALARKYLVSRPGWQMAIIPEGIQLPEMQRDIKTVPEPSQLIGPPAPSGR